MGQYETEGGGSSSGLNQKKYEAYRYGKIKELEAFRSELESQRILFEKKRAEQQGSAANLEQISQQVQAELLTSYPKPNSDLVDQSLRRQLNPLPEGVTEPQVQSQLDPIWKEINKSDPIGVIRELNRLQTLTQGSQKRTLQRELQISQVTDSKGLLRAPFTTTPNESLSTGLNTIEGQQIRTGINKVLATESLMGARCADLSESSTAECSSLHESLQGQVAAFYLLDRMITEQSEGMNSETVMLMNQLQSLAEFTLGVGAGVASGTMSLVEGIDQLLSHPVETTVALGRALTHLPSTFNAIKDLLAAKGDEFANGDAYVRGQIVGEAAVLVASMFIPAGEMTALLEGTVFIKTGVALSMAEVSASIGMAAKVSAASLRSTVLVERLGATGARAEQLGAWGEVYLAGKNGDVLTSALANLGERFNFVEAFEASVRGKFSQEAIEYVVEQIAFEKVIFKSEVTLETAQQIADIYDSIAPKLKALPEELIQPQVIEGTRAISKTWTDNMGVVHINTKSDVMKTHIGGLYSSHRFSRPNQNMLYVSTGENALTIALNEAGISLESAIISSRKFEMKRPLDLRDENVLRKLGIKPEQLMTRKEREGAYLVPQIIGELAQRNGFDSLIYKSSVVENGVNVGIFKNTQKEIP